MNEVIIRITDTDNNVLGDLDLTNFNDFPLAINKGIVNLDNLQARTGTFTKSFKVPNTKNNSNLLSSVDNINSRKDFRDSLNKKPCVILVNNNPIEQGFVQVSKVFNGFELDSFELVFYGNNIDWVKGAAEKKLQDLTFRNSPEVYNKANIKLANENTYTTYDHAYPFIDRSGDTSYKPVYYLRNIIITGLNSLGFNVESSFLDDSKINKLVCDFDLDFKVTDADFEDTVTTVKRTTNQAIPRFDNTRIIFDGVETDSNSNFNTTTGVYTVPQTGTYLIEFYFKIDVSTATFKLVKNGTSLTSIGDGIVLSEDGFAKPAGTGGGTSGYYFEESLTAGDEISIYVKSNIYSDSSTLTYNIEPSGGDTRTRVEFYRKKEITLEDTYNIAEVIPKEVTLLNVINDFSRMFNIYFWTDIKTKTIYLEPRDTFFKAESESLDWSNKLDISNDYEIDYVSSYKRNIEFKYKELKNDEWLKGWQDANKREYATYKHTLPNRFVEGTDTIGLDLFSASYSNIAFGYTGGDYNIEEQPITIRLWSSFGGPKPTEKIKRYNAKIYSFKYGTQLSSSLSFKKLTYFGSTTETIPYGIFQEYNSIPTDINLSFSGSDGLFATYYSNMFKNIEEGGRLIAMFNLNSSDIQNLDFRKLIYINQPSTVKGYYLIEKIIDYNPLNNNLTKVRLFKFENLGSVTVAPTQISNNSVDVDSGNNPDLLKPIYVEDGSTLIEVLIEDPITGLLEPVFK